ncbi:MAG: hypothetical protein WCR54_01765 [Clostridia bacterium]
MFGSNTLPLLLLLLLSNQCCDNNNTGSGCCNKSTLAMCLCLLCLMDNNDPCPGTTF